MTMKIRKTFALVMTAVFFTAALAMISGSSVSANPEIELDYDNFDDGALGTSVGGSAGVMSSSGEDNPTADFTSDSKAGASALSIEYSFSQDNWEGYWSFFNSDESGYDLSDYTDLRMWVKGSSGGEKFKVELVDTAGDSHAVYNYMSSGFEDGTTTSWQQLVIPLSVFSGVDMTSVREMNIIFDVPPTSGTVYIDEIKFTDQSTSQYPPGLVVDVFDDGGAPNELGGSAGTFDPYPDDSTQTIDETYVQDAPEGLGALKLDYDRGSSYVGYWTKLLGIDVSGTDSLIFYMKGAQGDEEYKIELTSGSNEKSIYRGTVPGTSYEEVTIPLSDFQGVDWPGYGPADLSQLEEMTITFDRGPSSGVVYVDSMIFTSGGFNNPPVADISATPSPASGTAPLTVDFDASGSSDSDGSIQSYSWEFGDGATGSGSTVSHTYSAGSYTATLTVTDDGGLADSTSVQVTASSENENTTTVSVSPSTQEILIGENFTVEVIVDPATAIAGVQFDLSFDPSLVAVNSVEEGNLLDQNGSNTYFDSGNIDNSNGTVTNVVGTITENASVSSPGTFATIDLSVKEVQNEGTSPLDLESVIVGDPNSNSVPTTVYDGSIDVMVYPDWDVSQDESVNVLDMIAVGQHFGESGSPHWIREDVNRDGTVNVLDMIMIGQHWTG